LILQGVLKHARFWPRFPTTLSCGDCPRFLAKNSLVRFAALPPAAERNLVFRKTCTAVGPRTGLRSDWPGPDTRKKELQILRRRTPDITANTPDIAAGNSSHTGGYPGSSLGRGIHLCDPRTGSLKEMLTTNPSVPIYLHSEPIDMRKSFDV